jgi:hypothetical protein
MTWQDALLVIETVFLIGIYFDDHAQKKMAEESLLISRESLEAQKQYLDLRRRWYESRMKKKDEKTSSGPSVSADTNSL